MTSESQTRYGSRVRRQGRSRRFASYHRNRARCSAAVDGPRGARPGAGRSSVDMADPDHIRDDFARLVDRPEGSLDLARAALLVAAESDPRLDVDGQLHTLDTWASTLRQRLEPG